MSFTLLSLLFIPFSIGVGAKIFLNQTINFKEMSLGIVIASLLIVIGWNLGKYAQTQDTEILNTYITDKVHEKDSYIRTYSCNCDSEDRCSVCTETIYTVDWYLKTPIKDIYIQSLESDWRSVWNKPDPIEWREATVGDPASIESTYTNYIQAVKDNLYYRNKENSSVTIKYPEVFAHYKINRVINYDTKIGNKVVKDLNKELNLSLKKLGAKKEANIVVIFTKQEQDFIYEIEKAWEGFNKNDVIVFIGLNEDKTIKWSDVSTWAGNHNNERLSTFLKDEIVKTNSVEPKTLNEIITKNVDKHYDRISEDEFLYLKDAIQPPTWVVILLFIISLFTSIGLNIYFHRNEI